MSASGNERVRSIVLGEGLAAGFSLAHADNTRVGFFVMALCAIESGWL